MDLLFLLGVLGLLSVPIAVTGAVLGRRGPELLSGLFYPHHDLGWPHGVQEEDGPVGWGNRVPLPHEATRDDPDLDRDLDPDRAIDTGPVRMRVGPGSARRTGC